MSGLSLTVLGCDGTYAGPGGACSGYLVEHASTSVWVDCGPGTLANLQQHVALDELSGIVVSHAHPDHWVELAVTINALHYCLGRKDIPLFTTVETLRRFEALGGVPVANVFAVHPISDGSQFELDGISFRTAVTDHPVETLSMRIEAGGRSLAYSADTGPGWQLSTLGEVDLALVEATMRADQDGLAPHLTTTQAGQRARDAGAGRLVITHLPPGADADAHRNEAAVAYGADVEVATTHLRIDL
ncbi:MAG: MBL fold metallo-hydrolase [Acidimicrobiales bacterium]